MEPTSAPQASKPAKARWFAAILGILAVLALAYAAVTYLPVLPGAVDQQESVVALTSYVCADGRTVLVAEEAGKTMIGVDTFTRIENADGSVRLTNGSGMDYVLLDAERMAIQDLSDGSIRTTCSLGIPEGGIPMVTVTP